MAQLKDSVVQGSLRVTDTIYTTNENISSLAASKYVKTDANKNLTTGDLPAGSTSAAGIVQLTDSYTSTDSSKATTGKAVAAALDALDASATGATSKTLTALTQTNGKIVTATFSDISISATQASLGNVSNNANLNKITGAKGDIIYWSAADTPAHLTNTNSATKNFLSITNQVPAWTTLSKSDVGLSNVTDDAQVKASLGTAKGDMIYWTGSAAPARLEIGTAGYILQATANGPAWTQTVAVANGGTGATSFTANSLIISGNTTTAALTTRSITNTTTAGALGGKTTWAADTSIPTLNTIANWDGRYQTTSNSSNLEYCKKGAFGDAVTYGVDDATANGALSNGTSLTTERSVYYGLVTVNGADQTRATGIYAPTAAGTSGQFLKSSGSGAPTWGSIATSDLPSGVALVKNVSVTWSSGTSFTYPASGTESWITADTAIVATDLLTKTLPGIVSWTIADGKVTFSCTASVSNLSFKFILLKWT